MPMFAEMKSAPAPEVPKLAGLGVPSGLIHVAVISPVGELSVKMADSMKFSGAAT
jgi:hypothetical protein